MKETEVESICPASRLQWRKWLQKNHLKRQAVWVICFKKEANIPTIAWSDAVDEALCFGWIDSQRNGIDGEKFKQRFSQRKPTSTWSKINKQKIQRLIQKGLMTPAGLKVIKTAKQNGTWSILDDVEELIVPKDLEKALKKKPGSTGHFKSLSRSKKRMALLSLVLAKRPETRTLRIQEIVESCVQK